MLQRGSTYGSKVQQAKQDFLDRKNGLGRYNRWKNAFFHWYWLIALVLGSSSVAVCVWRNGTSMMLTWIAGNVFAFGLLAILLWYFFPFLVVPLLLLRVVYYTIADFVSGVKSGAEG